MNLEKIQFSNGSIKDKNYIINNDNNLSNYNKNYTNKKHVYIAASLNPYSFDNNNNYNNDDNNNGDNSYNSHLINNKNILITGSKGKNIKQIKYDNNSLSKKDSKKFSNMAKTLKYFSNKGASYINYSNYDNISGKRSSDVNNNFLKNDFSNDKNNKPDNKSNINNNKINIRNLDIQTNNNKDIINQNDRAVPGIDIKKNQILLNINKDILSTKLDLKYKFLNEENKSKTPLKVNSRYYNNNQKNSSNEGGHKLNSGDNNLNEFLEKDEWDPNNKSKEIDKNVEEDKDVISYNIISNNRREFNNHNNSNKNNNINNYNNNENNVESNEQDNNQYFYNLSNLNRNKKKKKEYFYNMNHIKKNKKLNIEKNKVSNFTITNFSNKKNKYDQNKADILKEYQKSNLNDKTMKTPKSIKDNSPLDIMYSKSGKNYKIRNNRSFKNSFVNEPSLKEVNILNNDSNRKTSSNKNNIIPKVNINSENNNSKEKEKNTYNINIQQNIKNINQPIIINNKNQIQQIPSQKKIIINNNTENNNTENNNNDNITNSTNNFNNITNSIKLNGNDKNNIIIIKQNNNNKIIFHKKLNRSPPAFKKKPNIYNDMNNFDLSENNKSITRINKQNYQENSSPTNLQSILSINKLKTESNIYNYNNNFKSNILNIKENNIEINKIKTEKNINSIDFYKNPYIINRPNGTTIYKKQKAIKKIPKQKTITKGKLDVKVINEIKKEEKKMM